MFMRLSSCLLLYQTMLIIFDSVSSKKHGTCQKYLTANVHIFDTLKRQVSLFHAGCQRFGLMFLLSSYQRTMFVAKKKGSEQPIRFNVCRRFALGLRGIDAPLHGLRPSKGSRTPGRPLIAAKTLFNKPRGWVWW